VLFCDIERDTLNMDAARLREVLKVSGPVRAVIPVHMGGLPCDMVTLREAVQGAVLIEDAAHALGATYADGTRVGNCRYSELTTFSFHPVKSITTGEGGIITTNRTDLYRRLLRLRSHGINKANDTYEFPQQASTGQQFNRWYYEMQELGYNCRLTDIQAALGLSQLRKLERFLARRRELAHRYEEAFARDMRGVRAAQRSAKGVSARHLFVVRAPFGKGLPSRADFMQRLYERGYVTQVHYIPIPMHPYYARLGASMRSLPEAAAYYEEGLSIPLHVGLSDQQQGEFLRAFRESLQ
jgi:perosamine synthetase